MNRTPTLKLLSDCNPDRDKSGFIQEFGMKAFGLSRLPVAWKPPTLLISGAIGPFLEAEENERTAFFSMLSTEVQRSLLPFGKTSSVLVRSSATFESLLDRGRFLSIHVDTVEPAVIESACRNICDHFKETGAEGVMALMLQPQLEAKVMGHLANTRRVSKTRNHWQLEADSKNTELARDRDNFNSQRTDAAPSLIPLPCSSTYQEMRGTLQAAAAWLVDNISDVVSVEWLMTDDALYLVQCDDEVDPPGAVNPTQLGFPDVARRRSGPPPNPFQIYTIGTGSSVRKLAALDDFVVPSAATFPEIFYTRASELMAVLDQEADRSSLAESLDEFAPDGLVIRSDFNGAQGAEGMNLPRTDTISGAEAIAWLQTSIEGFKNAGISSDAVYFLMHRFIPARASAWSYAEPNDRFVRVDSLWGIPDGIQYFAHDTFEFDVAEDRISRPTIDYKPFFTWPEPGGKWRNMRVAAPKTRSQSISRTDVAYIAKYTLEVAKKIGKPAQIMWFCDFPKGSQFSTPLPWYRERSSSRPPKLEAAPRLPEIVITTIPEAVAVRDDKKAAKSKLVLIPNSDVIRDKKFIEAVAEAAKAGGHSVVLDGSPLAHAFHQMLAAGVQVYTSRGALRRRTIRKQSFGKLVRDKIPERIIKNGDAVTYGKVPRTERRKLLIAKAFEELLELASAEDSERDEEFADLYEVFSSLIDEFGTSLEEIQKIALEKSKSRGGFRDGIVLLGTNLPEQDSTDLLPTSTLTKREVKPKQAMASVTKILRQNGTISIPVLNLLGQQVSVPIFVAESGATLHLELSFDGDRIHIVGATHQKISSTQIKSIQNYSLLPPPDGK